jgi:hypothetical protein
MKARAAGIFPSPRPIAVFSRHMKTPGKAGQALKAKEMVAIGG